MQVTTLGAQLGLSSELVDWYRNATSVPFGHLLIDLSPRIDDRLRYRTNDGSVPSKFLYSQSLKAFKVDEHTTPVYSPSAPIAFTANAKAIFFSLAQKTLSGFYANA